MCASTDDDEPWGSPGRISISKTLASECHGTHGTASGTQSMGWALDKASTGQFYNFSNIRYAAPPLGNLRFAPPSAPTTRGVLNDGSRRAICPNATPGWSATMVKWLTEGIGSLDIPAGYTPPNVTRGAPGLPDEGEDCLFLDMLVPRRVFDENMKMKGAPVVVWIHGGGYTMGYKTQYGSGVGLLNASQRDEKEGVIYVAINYRLGAFGFLSSKTFERDQGTPNVGLLDQRFALQWVQNNIAKFGGDPGRVTVMGESAGGGSIMHQITAYGGKGPEAKAPFQQAIVQSGAFLPVPGMERQEAIYARFLSLAGVQTLAEARQLPTADLQFVNLMMLGEAKYGDFVFNPVVDGTFAPQLPGKALLDGSFDKSLHLMTGHNLEEGLIFTSPFVFTPETFSQNVVDVSFPDADRTNASDYILNTLYPDVLDGSLGYTNPVSRGAAIVSEALFSCNAQYLSKAFSSLQKPGGEAPGPGPGEGGRVWSYLFSVPPALHGDDVMYTFYEGPAAAVKNDTLAVMMQRYFMNFVAGGDPNGEGLPAFGTYSSEGTAVEAGGVGMLMEFGLNRTEMRVDNLPAERCGWWQQALYV
ncbi:uncharacterized protein L3040_005955 [Drepanopeziza brunnea f. sp. 'multigermtubi']|uniref:Carboxylic ester hydrolase n=1 Tax=Marssonina brunnea f. sp. multigermtubi (strain MB_m1) TaxID=1072389 RepID=K1X087_MARBU|nr:acetylcholinesterase precursor [Drepanopeziza brunnea f. sp. 'multigermtubi' MB_m1]EKD18586.1 acetylcholinesterase precursor [Drepanopeziza brunnea f. sp. 'multigermtubi' MB_m1]KAJ5040297.1 hypothetical protein L3040_005955 [Drepanopeziza brunnea f. sp. 'multigermtubi']